MNIQRTFGTVFGIAWVAGFGFWLASGHSDWHLIVLGMLANLPIVMTSYYYGHKHGYAARQAEVEQVVRRMDAIPRTPRLP